MTDDMGRLYHVNDVLTALAEQNGKVVGDDDLNELTHHVAGVLGISDSASAAPPAVRWITPNVANLFAAECANERDGGISPATIMSTIDSVVQAPEIMCPGWSSDDFVGLLAVTWVAGLTAQVGPLLDAYDDDDDRDPMHTEDHYNGG